MDDDMQNKIENFKRIYSEANTLGYKINIEKGKIRHIILHQDEVVAEKAKILEMQNNPQRNNPAYLRELRNRKGQVQQMEKYIDNMQCNLLLGLRRVKREVEDHINNLEHVIGKSRQLSMTPPPEDDVPIELPPGTPEAHLVRAGFVMFNFDQQAVNMQGNLRGNNQGNGNMQGNVAGNLQGNVVGNIQGNLPGNMQGNGAGNMQENLPGNMQRNLPGNMQGILPGNMQGNLQGAPEAKKE